MSKSNITRIIAILALVNLLATVATRGQSISPAGTVEANGNPRYAQRKARVMVLGTPHLSGISLCFVPDSVSLLIANLKDFAPDVIAIEKVPSIVLEEMERRGAFFGEIIKSFDGNRFQNGKKLQRLLSISRTEAERRALEMLNRLEKLERKERIELIKFLIASYEYETAVLQWSYFGADVRTERGVLPNGIVQDLDRSLNVLVRI